MEEKAYVVFIIHVFKTSKNLLTLFLGRVFKSTTTTSTNLNKKDLGTEPGKNVIRNQDHKKGGRGSWVRTRNRDDTDTQTSSRVQFLSDRVVLHVTLFVSPS